jgi:heterodisulfide reductase subunit B
MNDIPIRDVTYFPGCSLKTSSTEANEPLFKVAPRLGINLIELPDWSCCGSSSAHSLDKQLALDLASRNLILAPAGRPILVVCPSCHHRLWHAHKHLTDHPADREDQEKKWGGEFRPEDRVVHLFELLDDIPPETLAKQVVKPLNGLKFATYYGCMLTHPPEMIHEKNMTGIIERTLTALGGEPVHFPESRRCCGTFHAASKPEISTPLVNRIVKSAVDMGAECIVTSCAMCQLNLELRYDQSEKIPTLHLSQLLEIALEDKPEPAWFKKHLVDPTPVLRERRLIA